MIEQLITIFLGASEKADLVIPLPSFHALNYPPEILKENLPLIDSRVPTRYLFTTDMSQLDIFGPGGLAATADTYFDLNHDADVKFQHYDAKFALGIVDNKGFIIDEPKEGQPRISFARTKEERLSFQNFFENLWGSMRQDGVRYGVLYDDLLNQTFEDKRKQIIEVSNHILIDIINKLKLDPKKLFELTPRQFEELIGELLCKQGYSIQLTPQTRDGGKDLLIATSTELGDLLYLLECKLFSANNPVTVNIVRELYGVIEAERATAGLIVTSSTFTKDAIKFRENIKHRMSFKDYGKVLEWIDKY